MASNNPDSSATQSAVSEDPKADVNAAVEELLNTISNKFAGVSSEIFAKMDEMSRRLDNLEAALLANKDKEGGPPKSS
ncbi:heat shock factor binding protein 1 [Colletotrichum graminicola]|uniref:Heat shock factor binding protein 1 n=2 Tax=Colletotrichum graminicola species complex TaxID=2707348 RepID=E3QAX4_COLGM|nr:heat shock factor binding protein 1 [Colletotrichum graminicola M1.001]KAK1972903.1 heat shock factor binding protein 1 [Colletotrichum sublineola]KAK2019412.1 heat shock factor binding protein 1 [Colletotrichum eremochloae]KAK2043297.1 heat shock factor binding protein 1 [Colletotrichum somersetense]WDK12033.1 heat shock factor binding protein 1 [Colletotrichum graminicola]EFQ28012.1 heat shock factor binding protein 1 [Colletotrichum graminicola M1.001]